MRAERGCVAFGLECSNQLVSPDMFLMPWRCRCSTSRVSAVVDGSLSLTTREAFQEAGTRLDLSPFEFLKIS